MPDIIWSFLYIDHFDSLQFFSFIVKAAMNIIVYKDSILDF